MNTTKVASVAAAAILAAVSVPAAAQAGGTVDRINSGGCSGAADWKIKVSPQNGRIEVEYEVDASKRGQQWRVWMFHDGRRFARNVFTTQGLSGSFTIRRVEPNTAGGDRISAHARRLGDGQTCRGGVGVTF
jgi:hypothetical protein